jgi:AcrR family transcriptional regulator
MNKADIRRAALLRFSAQGYHATTLRELANDLGVTPAAFYWHYRTKDELLTELIESILNKDLDILRQIRVESNEALGALLHYHVLVTCRHNDEALVVQRESKFLPAEFRERVRRLIRLYEREFRECIEAEYNLRGQDLILATKAVLGMGANLAHWYRQDGQVSPEAMAEIFTLYARGLLKAAEEISVRSADGRPGLWPSSSGREGTALQHTGQADR